MSGKAAVHPAPAPLNGSIRDHRRAPRQMELFGIACGSTIEAPTWPDLPKETRRTLTDLMARLLLDHADRRVVGCVTEICNDL